MEDARKVISDNETAKIKLTEEMMKSRDQENLAVLEYQRMEDEKEKKRLFSIKLKADHMSKIMGRMADTVVKN